MTCARCGKANRENARFCDGCGSWLAPRCPACGAEGRPEARFCDACGASLSAKPPAAAEVRKTVTIVFADLIGSTSLQERLDPESVSRLAAILGSPGVGKSRLLAELRRSLGAQCTMLAARCDAAGGGTFAPLADAVQEHLGLSDAAGASRPSRVGCPGRSLARQLGRVAARA
jgi:hypothetical protein